MSFILDALKKSETDRQRQSSPSLFEVKVAAPRRRFPAWALGLGVLLGVNMLVLVWLLLRQTPAPAGPATTAAAPPAASAPAPDQGEAGMVTVKIPVGTASSFTVSPNKPEAGVVAPSSTPPLAEDPLLSHQEPSVPPDYDARDYAPAVSAAQAGTARNGAAPSGESRGAQTSAQGSGTVPSRDDVLAQGTQLPDLRLDLHSYAAESSQRFVFINMRKLREGESLPEGVRVEHITPTGVLLSYHGTSFTLQAN